MNIPKTPCAFLFQSGNAAYFNESNNQISTLQSKGWKGLHQYLKEYPHADVYMGTTDCMSKENITGLLKHIRKS
jgi:hypothetical protein